MEMPVWLLLIPHRIVFFTLYLFSFQHLWIFAIYIFRDVKCDFAGNVYVADAANCLIRKISPTQITSTFAGINGTCSAVNGAVGVATFNYPVI